MLKCNYEDCDNADCFHFHPHEAMEDCARKGCYWLLICGIKGKQRYVECAEVEEEGLTVDAE